MSTVTHQRLLNFPHIPPSIPVNNRPKLLSSLSLYRKSERLLSLSASLSLSPLTTHEFSSSSSTPPSVEKEEAEEMKSVVDGFFYLLRLSAQYHDVEVTKAVHASFLKLREEKTRLGNALISTYLKLGFPRDAFLVFVSLSSPTVVSYTALISGLSRLNFEIEALKVFFRMRKSGIIQPNEYTFVAILTACVKISQFSLGIQIHGLIVKSGFLNSVYVGNSLMSLYAKDSGSSSDDVLKLFDEIPHRDLASWNTVISCLVKEGKDDKAFDLFYEMNRVKGLGVDSFTLSTLLSSCTGSSSDLLRGRELHGRAIRLGLKQELSVNNALIGFYSRFADTKKVENLYEMMMVRDAVTLTEMITAYMAFGMVESAVELFESIPEINAITYNSFMAGFCKNGHGLKALKIFIAMLQRGVELTDFSLTSAVDACGLHSDKKVSEQIHGFCLKFGCASNPCIQTALLDMCTRCERMADAEEMFDQWPSNLDSSKATTSMLGGYARNGLPDKALSLFHRTVCEEKLVLDEVSLTLILAICGTLGFREMGDQIHSYALKGGYFSDVGLGNSLISMYSKCCHSDDSTKVFNTMGGHDVVSWNSLISCYILQRNGDEALALWSRMDEENMPDAITLALVISAFRYTESNKVSSCRNLFLSMKTIYGIEPTTGHYTAFISVLGHWGFLDEAEDMVNSMPFQPEVSVLRALLDSCRVHSNTSIANRVAKLILAIKPENSSEYILKSNICSASGLWHRSEMIREEMREKGYRKHPSKSWIIHENKIHSFYARDTSHPQEKDIYSGLEILIMECLKAGYEPNTEFVLQEVGELMKKSFLFHHSAKLAVTYGILTSNTRGKPVRVVKNVMLCGDCHEFFKYVSVVVKREIVLRDSSGFHRFVNGKCYCKDLW